MAVHPFKAWRVLRGISLEEARRRSGLASSTIRVLENGQSRVMPYPQVVAPLARITHGEVPVEQFIDFDAFRLNKPRAREMHPMRLWRYRNGVTAATLAERAHTSSGHVANTEVYRWQVAADTAARLSAATNHEVSAEEILNWRPPETKEKEREMKAEITPNLRRATVTDRNDPLHGQVAMFARCTDCGEEKVRFPARRHSMPPSDLWHGKLQRLGWIVKAGGRKQVCPACRRIREQRATEGAAPMTNGHEQPHAQRTEEATPKMTPDQFFLVVEDLKQHFDPKAGRYRPGHSDGTIAEARGVTREQVSGFREKYVGPLNIDKNLELAERRIAHLRTYVRELKDEAMPKIEEFLDRLTRAEEKLGEAEGWLKGESAPQ